VRLIMYINSYSKYNALPFLNQAMVEDGTEDMRRYNQAYEEIQGDAWLTGRYGWAG
jgi:hypothetical protein